MNDLDVTRDAKVGLDEPGFTRGQEIRRTNSQIRRRSRDKEIKKV
jgi:hypothetical protein